MDKSNKIAKDIIKRSAAHHAWDDYKYFNFYRLGTLSIKQLLEIDLSEEEIADLIRQEQLRVIEETYQDQLSFVKENGNNGAVLAAKQFHLYLKQVIARVQMDEAARIKAEASNNLYKIQKANSKKLAKFTQTLTPAQQKAFQELVK